MEILLPNPTNRPLQILCIGAHADDIEIGCGGTILKLIAEGRDMSFDWVVLSGMEQRKVEARDSAEAFLHGVEDFRIHQTEFRDGYFPSQFGEIKQHFETFKEWRSPDMVFTHFRNDRHQDHRVVSDLTWNTFRGHMILEYEIPKFDGDLGQPNLFVQLSAEIVSTKIELLLKHFPSQSAKKWFSSDTFRGLMRLRGIESAPSTAFAEAFHARKMVVGSGRN